jgi:UDP-2,4-diacetamido-2,4,6-trideoxy-beta-L-altropyranose hydrolase
MRADGALLIARADASRAAGTGHFMRTLALAQAWRDAGGRVRWLLTEAPPALRARLDDEGIEQSVIPGPRAGAADAAALRRAMLADAHAVAVVDGLEFDDAYLAGLGSVAPRTLLIDDAAARTTYPVGFVLNQNAHADRAVYPTESPARFLLGTRFALLRREFAAVPPARTIPARAHHLLVGFGGADPHRMSGRTLDALAGLPAPLREQLEVRMVAGAANLDGPALESTARSLAGSLAVTVHQSVRDMTELLAWADLAVTSGGSTVWEMARMGCPAIVIETVPVETLLTDGLRKVGLGDLLGRAEALDGATICAAVARRLDDAAWREEMSALGARLVDGQGAGRVVDALLQEGTAT